MKYQDFKSTLNEASSISLDELPEDMRVALEKFNSKHGTRIRQVWDGIHGYIYEFQVAYNRMDSNTLKKFNKLLADMSKFKTFRWMDIKRDSNEPTTIISIGL